MLRFVKKPTICPVKCTRAFASSSHPDFMNHRDAYGHKSTGSLIRSLLVFRMCTLKPIVNRANELLSLSRRILGAKMTENIVRQTFFAQFCGGESENDIVPTVRFLKKHHVGGILDYAAEADLASDDDDSTNNMNGVEDSNINVAREYDYVSEKECDANLEIFLNAVNAVHNATPDGFAAIKVTALGNPKLLKRVSTLKYETARLFERFDRDNDRVLELDEFVTGFTKYFKEKEPNEAVNMFRKFTVDDAKTSNLDLVDWKRFMSSEDISRLARQCIDEGPLYEASLSEEELELYDAMYGRLKKISELAHEKGVRLMIDAEQTYFQHAIDSMVLRLQRRFNKERCVVYNTYQCYLKDSSVRLQIEFYIHHRVSKTANLQSQTQIRLKGDMERSARENFCFAAKLVRGAYMYSERELAEEEGRESPIHDSLDDTHASYDRNMESVLKYIDENKNRAEVMFATHNSRSVKFAVRCMQDWNIPRESVYFGQLLGMADNITFPLGSSGYNVYKYVPYGPIYEVMPYLVRRAQENSDLLGGVSLERNLLWKELKSRFTAV